MTNAGWTREPVGPRLIPESPAATARAFAELPEIAIDPFSAIRS
jgi:hypothetical protein